MPVSNVVTGSILQVYVRAFVLIWKIGKSTVHVDMSPLLGIVPLTELEPVSRRRRSANGKFPISKGFTLLSVSRSGKGNSTPWRFVVKVVAAQMLFDKEEKKKKKGKRISAGVVR